MTAQVRPQYSAWQDTMIEAMRAELDWAPMTFPSWTAYEHARPLLPGETYEIIGHFPQHGYILQYRRLLGELTQSNRLPIDQRPEVTVRGSVKAAHLAQLRRLDQRDDPQRMKDYIDRIVQPTYTLPTPQTIRTGSPIPEHSHLYPEYEINPTEPSFEVGICPNKQPRHIAPPETGASASPHQSVQPPQENSSSNRPASTTVSASKRSPWSSDPQPHSRRPVPMQYYSGPRASADGAKPQRSPTRENCRGPHLTRPRSVGQPSSERRPIVRNGVYDGSIVSQQTAAIGPQPPNDFAVTRRTHRSPRFLSTTTPEPCSTPSSM